MGLISPLQIPCPFPFFAIESRHDYTNPTRQLFPKNIPRFSALFKDFSTHSDEEIAGDIQLQSILLALRRIKDKNLPAEFRGFIDHIFQMSETPEGVELLEEIVYYFVREVGIISPEEMKQALASQGPVGDRMMETIAYQLEERGRIAGIEQGIEQGITTTLNILASKFGNIPATLQTEIEQIDDLERLSRATVQAAVSESLDLFIRWMEEQEEG